MYAVSTEVTIVLKGPAISDNRVGGICDDLEGLDERQTIVTKGNSRVTVMIWNVSLSKGCGV